MGCHAIEISQIDKTRGRDVAQMKVAQLQSRSIEMSRNWDVDQMKSRANGMSRKKKVAKKAFSKKRKALTGNMP